MSIQRQPFNSAASLWAVLLSFSGLTAPLFTFATIEVSPLISNGMVIQREMEIPFHGQAHPETELTITFAGNSTHLTVGDDGRWQVTFPPLEAGGPHTLTIADQSEELLIEDILVGDIWLASGQSNMELPMARVDERYAEVIANSFNPQIRMFTVPMEYEFKEAYETLSGGEWISANPDTILSFPAVGYFFAHEIHEHLDIPVAIILNAVGGAPIEAYMSRKALAPYPEAIAQADLFTDDAYVAQVEEENEALQQRWHGHLHSIDAGFNGPIPWYDPTFEPEGWKPFEVPGFWSEQGIEPMHGSIWFRREIDVPEALAGKPARLYLGTIVDADTAYLNGELVGRTYYQYPPRRYDVPAGLLRSGRNVITLRVTSDANPGGFIREKPYFLQIGNEQIDLTGTWHYAIGGVTGRIDPTLFVRWQPTALYYSMVVPLQKTPIKGVIWYQGETNTRAPQLYLGQMEAMVNDWRQGWQQDELPFITVQLANFMEPRAEPMESNWAELRDQQRQALSIPHTGMAITIDLGEWNDIHPQNKSDVGRRLALEARRVVYGEPQLSSPGPLFVSAHRKGREAIVQFEERTGPLRVENAEHPRSFELAGRDGRFYPAQARIEGNTVILSSPSVRRPIAVRYAWAHNPVTANLYNADGLPASPFEAKVQN